MNKTRIVIFAKAPLPGLAKTRLIPALGEDGTALLARRMLLHTIHEALASDIGPVELCVTPDADNPVWKSLKLPDTVLITLQGDGDLGQRMSNAARRVINQGEPVILIGTDCPALNAKHLMKLAKRLQDARAVMLPTMDGGYVSLGLSCYDDRIFDDIAWSTNKVAKQTIMRLMDLNLAFYVGAKLHDIDEPGDLQCLPDGWGTELDPAMDFHSVME